MIHKFFLCSFVMLIPTLLFAGQHPMRTSADTNTAIMYAPRYLPPADEKPMMIELGAGFGLPYGLF